MHFIDILGKICNFSTEDMDMRWPKKQSYCFVDILISMDLFTDVAQYQQIFASFMLTKKHLRRLKCFSPLFIHLIANEPAERRRSAGEEAENSAA